MIFTTHTDISDLHNHQYYTDLAGIDGNAFNIKNSNRMSSFWKL